MDWIKFCKNAGRGVSKEVLKVYKSDLRTKQYGRGKGGDITLEGDKVGEEIIIRHLKELGLNIYFISEEIGELKIGRFKKPTDADYIVIVDPLDGSFNFKNKIGHFGTSIAVLNPNYEVIAGYVRDIPNKMEYYAEKGGGCFVDGKRVHTRTDSDKIDILLECSPRSSHADIEFLSRAFLSTRRARAFGSVALDLCRVADGRFHSLIYSGCSRYLDVAAGIFLVKEAGGIVTDFNGNEQITKGTKLIAKNLLASANKKVHEKLLKNRWIIPPR